MERQQGTFLRVTKKFTFDMAHALYGYDGPCKNIHGHTYHLYVTLKGKPISNSKDSKNGMVHDFTDLKDVVKEKIISRFDHALVLNKNSPHKKLNEHLTDQFEKIIFLEQQPTCENLLQYFQQLLWPVYHTDVLLVSMKLEETPTSYAEWILSDNQ